MSNESFQVAFALHPVYPRMLGLFLLRSTKGPLLSILQYAANRLDRPILCTHERCCMHDARLLDFLFISPRRNATRQIRG